MSLHRLTLRTPVSRKVEQDVQRSSSSTKRASSSIKDQTDLASANNTAKPSENFGSSRFAGTSKNTSVQDAVLGRNAPKRSATRGARAARLGAQHLQLGQHKPKGALRKNLKKAMLGAMIGISLLNPVGQAFADIAPHSSNVTTTQQVQSEQTSNAPFSLFNLQLNERAASSQKDGGIHLLQAGETLGQVAIDNDVTLAELLAVNPDLGDLTQLRIGTAIQLPGDEAQPAESGVVSPHDAKPVESVAEAVQQDVLGLEVGDTGPAVLNLQQTFRDMGFRLGVDGSFGAGTEKVLERFQAGQGISQTGVVDAQTVAALQNGLPTADVKPETQGVSERNPFGRYAPHSAEAKALFTDAAEAAGIDVSWATNSALHDVLAKETQGRVGIPNYTFGKDQLNGDMWAQIHRELQSGMVRTESTATGLGQMTLPNVDKYYPDGRAGIGDPLNEAIGMLKYVQDRYGSPEAALTFHNANHWY